MLERCVLKGIIWEQGRQKDVDAKDMRNHQETMAVVQDSHSEEIGRMLEKL